MAAGVDTGGGQDRECGDSTANWVDSLEESEVSVRVLQFREELCDNEG